MPESRAWTGLWGPGRKISPAQLEHREVSFPRLQNSCFCPTLQQTEARGNVQGWKSAHLQLDLVAKGTLTLVLV